MAHFVVVLDANVLYCIAVTDLMATMATRRLFRPHWSPQILDEVTRNLNRRPDLNSAAVARRIEHLNRALPDALVQVPASLIEAMPINETDRHVLALAVHVGAQAVVTDNLRDFPLDLLDLLAEFGVDALSPGAFTLAQIDVNRDAVAACITGMAARRRNPPMTSREVVDALSRFLPESMARLRSDD